MATSSGVTRPTILDYLRQLQQQGASHVAVDDEARQVLRELYTRGSARRAAPKATKVSENVPANASAAPQAASPAPLTSLKVSGTTAAEKITSIKEQAQSWQPSLSLGTLRKELVFSTGNPAADFMLVGEAPGFHEEQQAEPFVGPAGQKLDQILKAMGLSREQVYLSNVCKFRPATRNQTTNNRKPSPEELAACLPFIKAEVDIVKPRVIVALGASAADALLELKKPVGELREAWHQFQGIPLRVTYHPSYLLRQEEGLGEKRKVWEDMLAVMEKLKLEISEKQRGYFKK